MDEIRDRTVYFAAGDGMTKVGSTSNHVSWRLRDLRRTSGLDLEIVYAAEGNFRIEYAIHALLSPRLLGGREWFQGEIEREEAAALFLAAEIWTTAMRRSSQKSADLQGLSFDPASLAAVYSALLGDTKLQED